MNLKNLLQAPTHSKSTSIGLLMLRLVCGGAFMIHGYGKILSPMTWMGPEAPVPGIFQLLAALSEFGGGIAWILGLVTPLASLGLAFTMMVAAGMHAFVLKDPFVNLEGGRSYELAAVFLCVSILLLLAGPGKLSADAKVFGERASR